MTIRNRTFQVSYVVGMSSCMKTALYGNRAIKGLTVLFPEQYLHKTTLQRPLLRITYQKHIKL